MVDSFQTDLWNYEKDLKELIDADDLIIYLLAYYYFRSNKSLIFKCECKVPSWRD